MTLALGVAFIGAFNTLSLIFVIMFFGLGVDFAVHFGLRIREEAQHKSYLEAFIGAVQDIGPALMMCMMTSSIAFLAFVPTPYVGLGELGLISAMGMLVALVLTMAFLPILLSFVSLKPEQALEQNATQTRTQSPTLKPESSFIKFFALLGKLHSHQSNANKIIVAVFIVLVIGAGWIAKDQEFDYSVLALRDASTEGMQTLLSLQEAGISTDYSISVLAADASQAELLVDQLSQLPLVGNVMSPDQILPNGLTDKRKLLRAQYDRFSSIEEVLGSEDHSKQTLQMALEYLQESVAHATANDQLVIHRFVMRLEALTHDEIALINESMPLVIESSLNELEVLLATNPFTIDQIPIPLLRRFITADGEHLLRVQPSQDISNRETMTAFIEQVAAVAPMVAGRSVVEWGVGDLVVSSFVQASLTALVGIFLVLTLFFRNLILPILVLVPIGVSLLFTLALCQLFGLSLNMANVLVVPLIIGLGVDTGIHVVHRATSIEIGNLLQTSTSRAVVISALTTIGTFFSLSFSPHLGAASIGLLLTVAISLLVVVTFVLLPALISVCGLEGERSA